MSVDLKFFQEPKKPENQSEKSLNDLVFEVAYGATETVEKLQQTARVLTQSLERKEGVDPTYTENYRQIEAAISKSLDKLVHLQHSMTQDTAANEEPTAQNR